jgi:hypothetical protein
MSCQLSCLTATTVLVSVVLLNVLLSVVLFNVVLSVVLLNVVLSVGCSGYSQKKISS